LNGLNDYIQAIHMTIEQAFSVFDADGSGQISVDEFVKILDRVCGRDSSE
jgi:Ca2+-binding EF-hand superfamily protein